VSSVAHLARRWWGSLSRAEPAVVDVEWVRSVLEPGEWGLWSSMPVQDRRHSIVVARRFSTLVPSAGRAALAGALLHDVGKQASGLGTSGRVLATIVGPHGARFRRYHDHEAIGAAMLRDAGSDPVTIELVEGRGELASSLYQADNV
jgi:putative nucleotidyltransferase with HDIG domain